MCCDITTVGADEQNAHAREGRQRRRQLSGYPDNCPWGYRFTERALNHPSERGTRFIH